MARVRTFLIVANSARMLAQFASRLDLRVFVIDCFADCDTQEFAQQCVKVDCLALDQVKKALANLNLDSDELFVIYGSGLESSFDTLIFLQKKFTLVGNVQDVFLATQNKSSFYSRLTKLQINYPEVCFQVPEKKGRWLSKPACGEGGVGIEDYKGIVKVGGNRYWQRYVEGVSMSAIFVANGSEYQLVGFHKQFCTQIDSHHYVFSGLINQLNIDTDLRRTISLWLKKIVKAFNLKGINSLDFIVSDRKIYVLEVNPRPSASMQLYSEELLTAHIDSFLFNEFNLVETVDEYRAYKIIFATTHCCINKSICWPDWVVDIPQPFSNIHIGMPICSIIASGINEQQVEQTLQARELIISKLLR